MNTFTRPVGTTRQHRGLRSYRWSSAQTVSVLLLFAANWLLLWLLHTPIQRLWAALMGWAWPRLGLGPSSAVALDQVRFVGLPWDVVALQVSAAAPSTRHAWMWLITLALLFIVSLLMPRRQLPWIYFLRAFVFLCAMSVAAFFWVPALFHIEVGGYFNDMMKIGAILLWLLPLMHAVLLYIFPLSLADKLLATLAGVLFLVLSVPLHVASLAWIVHETNTLAMLPIYMLATFLPPVFAQLGIYSYFISRARVAERRGAVRPRLAASVR